MDKKRFQELNYKITKKEASLSEKSEYMDMLYENGSITENQYKNYKNGKDRDTSIKLGLIVGAGLLLGWLVKGLTD